MEGYYVIPKNGDVIEKTGKNARKRALEKARDLINNHNDTDVMVQQFDDSNEDGYTGGLETIYAKDII